MYVLQKIRYGISCEGDGGEYLRFLGYGNPEILLLAPPVIGDYILIETSH